jgi:hypothetical protein
MTLTNRLALGIAACFSVVSLAFAAPADACGDYGSFKPRATVVKKAERISGHVVAFKGLPAIKAGKLVIQYPRFHNSGQFLYLTDVTVPRAQLAPLKAALADALTKGETARAAVELEQVSANEWRLVSFNLNA